MANGKHVAQAAQERYMAFLRELHGMADWVRHLHGEPDEAYERRTLRSVQGEEGGEQLFLVSLFACVLGPGDLELEDRLVPYEVQVMQG
jgi:hypothetical protein